MKGDYFIVNTQNWELLQIKLDLLGAVASCYIFALSAGIGLFAQRQQYAFLSPKRYILHA